MGRGCVIYLRLHGPSVAISVALYDLPQPHVDQAMALWTLGIRHEMCGFGHGRVPPAESGTRVV